MTALYDRVVATGRRVYAASIDTPAVLDAAAFFPASAMFQAACPQIRSEAQQLHASVRRRFSDLMPEQAGLANADGRDWRLVALKLYGREIAENMALMPHLSKLIRDTPEVLSAAISILPPHKVIPRHQGPFKGILRFHLILDCPLADDGLPATCLVIEDRLYRLGEGQSLLWDDTFPHEVSNRSGGERLALLLDIWRPAMPVHLQALSLVSAFAVRAGMSWRGVTFRS